MLYQKLLTHLKNLYEEIEGVTDSLMGIEEINGKGEELLEVRGKLPDIIFAVESWELLAMKDRELRKIFMDLGYKAQLEASERGFPATDGIEGLTQIAEDCLEDFALMVDNELWALLEEYEFETLLGVLWGFLELVGFFIEALDELQQTGTYSPMEREA